MRVKGAALGFLRDGQCVEVGGDVLVDLEPQRFPGPEGTAVNMSNLPNISREVLATIVS